MDDTVVTGRDGIGSDYRWTIEKQPVTHWVPMRQGAEKGTVSQTRADSRCVRSAERRESAFKVCELGFGRRVDQGPLQTIRSEVTSPVTSDHWPVIRRLAYFCSVESERLSYCAASLSAFLPTHGRLGRGRMFCTLGGETPGRGFYKEKCAIGQRKGPLMSKKNGLENSNSAVFYGLVSCAWLRHLLEESPLSFYITANGG